MLTRFFDVNDTLSFFDSFERQMQHAFSDPWTHRVTRSRAENDLILRDEGDKLTVTTALPGLKESDIEITLENGILSLKAERKLEVPKDFKLVRRERAHVRLARQIELPVPVEADKIEATFTDGILTLSLPKAPEAKPRKILIGSRTPSNAPSA